VSNRGHTDQDGQQLKNLAKDLIQAQSTMTLATSNGSEAWAAPVYFAFLKSCFYFFSDPSSRHIMEALASGQASSAIYAEANTWQGIRGIQMSGTIETVGAGIQAIEAIRAYLKRFSFTKEFFSGGESMDLAAFTKRFKVKLYRFRPALIYYMDNSIRFGFREEISL